MSTLFVYMMYTQFGWDVFRNPAFNTALRKVLQDWYAYLDSAASGAYLNSELPSGWLSQPAREELKLYEFEVDPVPSSFNAFFHRQIKPGLRPIARPQDPGVIVSANDGTVLRWAQVMSERDDHMLKGQPYSLKDMLAGRHVERFVGGHVFQTFLSGASYHRWCAPIDGTVVDDPTIIPGMMFSELRSAGWDPTAGTYSQGYEAAVNTRGLLFLESDHRTAAGEKLLVCVMPIGITEISSVSFVNKDSKALKKGDKVSKGDELGRFSYGGSSMCLLFGRGVVKRFVPPANTGASMDNGPAVYTGMHIATADVTG